MKDKNAQMDALLKIIQEEVKEMIKAPKVTEPEENESANEFSKTVEMEPLPKFVPEKLRELTLDQTKKLAKWFAEKPFKDLIHRQDLTNRQIRQAIRKGNSIEQNELRILDAILEKAMVIKNSELYMNEPKKVTGTPDEAKKN